MKKELVAGAVFATLIFGVILFVFSSSFRAEHETSQTFFVELIDMPLPDCDTEIRQIESIIDTEGNVHAFQQIEKAKNHVYLHWNLESRFTKAEEYLHMAKNIFEESGLPTELAYVMIVESGGDPYARSSAGAVGLWQFMPVTARQFGLIVNSQGDDRTDPVKSTRAAAQYLKSLYSRFGSWELALSAYNAGQSRVARIVARERTSDFWQLQKRRVLPPETRDYIPRFIAVVEFARSLQSGQIQVPELN